MSKTTNLNDDLSDLLRRFGLGMISRDGPGAKVERMDDYQLSYYLAAGQGIGFAELSDDFPSVLLRDDCMRGYRAARKRKGWPMEPEEETWLRENREELAAWLRSRLTGR